MARHNRLVKLLLARGHERPWPDWAWKIVRLLTAFLWGMSFAFLVRALDPPWVRGRAWYGWVFGAAVVMSILCAFGWAERHEKAMLKQRHDELIEREQRPQ